MPEQASETYAHLDTASMDAEEKENLLKQLLEDLNYQHPHKKSDRRFSHEDMQLREILGNDNINWPKIKEGANVSDRAKWLRNARLDKRVQGISDDVALRKAVNCMDEEGKFWYAELIEEEHFLTWNEFVERYKDRFFPASYKSNIRTELANLRQRTDESVDALMSIIKAMFDELDSTDSIEIEDVFIRALREPMRKDVKMHKANNPNISLAQLKKYAKASEEATKERFASYTGNQQSLFRNNYDNNESTNNKNFKGRRGFQGSKSTNKGENNRITNQGTSKYTSEKSQTFTDTDIVQVNKSNPTQTSPDNKNSTDGKLIGVLNAKNNMADQGGWEFTLPKRNISSNKDQYKMRDALNTTTNLEDETSIIKDRKRDRHEDSEHQPLNKMANKYENHDNEELVINTPSDFNIYRKTTSPKSKKNPKQPNPKTKNKKGTAQNADDKLIKDENIEVVKGFKIRKQRTAISGASNKFELAQNILDQELTMKLSTLLEVSPKVKAEIIRKINPRSQEESLLVTNNSKLLVSKISDKATLPVRANNTDAGLDLAITDEVTLNPGQTKLLNTGLAIALPKGTAGKIVTRSSLALNKSIDIKAGLIDEGYTGEIKILVHNTGANKVKLNAKEYIAQLLIIKCERPEIELVRPENLPETRRANKGFGSSNKITGGGCPVTDVIIENKHFKCYLDGGSGKNIISSKTAKELEMFDLDETGTTIKTVNNVVKPLGEINNVLIEIGSIKMYVNFIVIDHNDHLILLGRTWLNEMNAQTIWDTGRFILYHNGKEAIIDTENNVTMEWSEPVDAMLAYSLDDEDVLTIDNINLQKAYKFKLSDIKKLLAKHKNITANKLSELKGTHVLEHKIDVLPDARPIYQGVAKSPSNLHHIIQKEIDEMLDAGIIRRSSSPWASRLVLAPKKDGSHRLYFNYKPLNEVTLDDRHPLPRIQDLIDSLQEGRVFSTIDLKAGYWQMKVRKEDQLT